MKTKQKLLFVGGLLIAACIGFVIGIIVDYPAPVKSELAGTIGKASKYNKSKMSQRDIELRSELIKDTAQLRKTVQGLVYFSVFSKDLVNDIDLSVLLFKSRGMTGNPGEGDPLQALQDYADFIRNNTETLDVTIQMMTSFLQDDSVDQSFDVERNMREFGLYVNRLNEKSNVLNQALAGMDEFLTANESLRSNLKEVVRLRSIRDQLVIQGVRMGSLTGNPMQVSSLLDYIVLAQDKLNIFCSQEQIRSVNSYQAAENDLGLIVESKESLSRLVGREDLKMTATNTIDANTIAAAGENSGMQVIVYCANTMQFIAVTNPNDINVVIGSASSLNSQAVRGFEIMAIAVQDNLNIMLNQYQMQDVMSATLLERNALARPLHSYLDLIDLGVIVLSQEGIFHHEL